MICSGQDGEICAQHRDHTSDYWNANPVLYLLDDIRNTITRAKSTRIRPVKFIFDVCAVRLTEPEMLKKELPLIILVTIYKTATAACYTTARQIAEILSNEKVLHSAFDQVKICLNEVYQKRLI